MVHYRLCTSLLITLAAMVCFCGKKSPNEPDSSIVKIPKKNIAGIIQLPAQTAVQSSDLTIHSVLQSKASDGDGGFSLQGIDGDKPQIILATNQDDKPVLLAPILAGQQSGIELSARTTASALVLLNPCFMLTDNSQREGILTAAQNHTGYAKLVSDIESLFKNDPENVLDYFAHPRIYEQAMEIGFDLLKSSNANQSLQKSTQTLSGSPWIEDAPGENITFINPNACYLAAAIDQDGEDTKERIRLLDAKSSFFSLRFGWPPVGYTEPTETNYNLGNGGFQIRITKGFMGEIVAWTDITKADGLATVCNLGKGVFLICDLVIGYMPTAPVSSLRLDGTQTLFCLGKMEKDLLAGDTWSFFLHFGDLIKENVEPIAYWLWQDATSDEGRNMVSKMLPILQSAAAAAKVVSASETAANQLLPFLYDLFSGDRVYTVYVQQSNGTLIQNKLNSSPSKPEAWSDSDWSIINEELTFNAVSRDPEGDPIAYRFHWGDGTSSGWSDYIPSETVAFLKHAYAQSGNYLVAAEAKDQFQGQSEISRAISLEVTETGTYFYYNFDHDMPGVHPASPPWTSLQKEPSYLRIVSDIHYGSSGNSCAFYDYDPTLDTDAEEYSQIYADIRCANKGSIEFTWRVKSPDDNFGLRAWQEWEWDVMGFYVLFLDGYLRYYTGSSFPALMAVEANRWYRMRLNFDQSSSTYDIYIDGQLKGHNIAFVGNPASLNLLQIVAFSDTRCSAAYIDEIRMTGATMSSLRKALCGREPIVSIQKD